MFVCGKEMQVASGKNQQPLRVEAQQASEHLNLSPPTAVSVWRRALATASCHPRRTIFQLDWVSHFTCRGGCAAVLLWMLFSVARGINKEDGTGLSSHRLTCITSNLFSWQTDRHKLQLHVASHSLKLTIRWQWLGKIGAQIFQLTFSLEFWIWTLW